MSNSTKEIIVAAPTSIKIDLIYKNIWPLWVSSIGQSLLLI